MIDAPAHPCERLAYLAERAGLLAEVEESAECAAYARARAPHPGPPGAVRTAREAARTLLDLPELCARPDFRYLLGADVLEEVLRGAEALAVDPRAWPAPS